MKKLSFIKYTIIVFIFLFLAGCINTKVSQQSNLATIDNKKLNSILIDAKKDLLYGTDEMFLSKINQIIEIDSNYAVAYFELSRFYLQRKDYKKATENAQKAYELLPTKNEYQRLYAQTLDASNNFDQCFIIYKKLLSKNEGDLDLWYELFRFFDKYQKYNLLDSYLDDFEANFGLSEDIVVNRYQNLIKQKRYKSIEKYLLSVTKRDPKMEIANLILGDYYFTIGKLDRADAIYDKILFNNEFNEQALVGKAKISLQKGDITSVMQFSSRLINNPSVEIETKLSIIIELSKAFENINGFDISKLDNFIVSLYNQYPDNPDVLYFHGNILFRNGKNSEALKDYLYALKIKPSNMQLWLFSLYILEKEKDYTRLISIADSALIYFPNQKDLFLLRGFAFMQTEQYEKSLADFLFAKRLTGLLDEDRVQILHYLAEVYFKLNRKSETFSLYDEILKIDENDLVALNNYAYYLALDNTNLEKALEMSSRSIKLEQNNDTYLDTYAYILFKLKKSNKFLFYITIYIYKLIIYSESLVYIEKDILHGGTNSPVILDHYGDILYMNGQKELAVSTWREAKDKGLDNELINKKIEFKQYFYE